LFSPGDGAAAGAAVAPVELTDWVGRAEGVDEGVADGLADGLGDEAARALCAPSAMIKNVIEMKRVIRDMNSSAFVGQSRRSLAPEIEKPDPWREGSGFEP
jgi:hypothetical protein